MSLERSKTRLWAIAPVWFLLLSLFLSVGPATAHSYNQSYVYFDVAETTLGGRIEVTLTDLAQLLAGDASIDTPLSEAEAVARKDEIFSYFEEHLQIFSDGAQLPVAFSGMTFLPVSFDVYAGLEFDVPAVEETPITIDMSYNALFDDVDPSHRGFALIGSNARNGMDENEGYISLVFLPGVGVQELFLNDQPTHELFQTYVEAGALQMVLGVDHLLLWITLFLSAVLVRAGGGWDPSDSLIRSVGRLILLVFAFTTAHLIALGLSSFDVVSLPIPAADAIIALAIIAVAFRNFSPQAYRVVWVPVILFASAHGLGFSAVLAQLGDDAERQAIGLLGFNLGLGLALLLLAFLFVPLLYVVRRLPAYASTAVRGGAIAVMVLAVVWFGGRTVAGFAATERVVAEASQ